jgi:hypothetical protein
VPAIVCWAFAAEIHLKIILSGQSKTPRSHNLAALFRLLPGTLQTGVKRIVNFDDAEFRKQLARFADAFAEGCYVSEVQSRSLNLRFLNKFAAAVQFLAGQQTRWCLHARARSCI